MTGVRVDFTKTGKPVTHGGAGAAYSHYGCRCGECTEANARRAKRRWLERRVEAMPEQPHGQYSTYVNWSCRCVECTEAGRLANKKQYEKRKQATK